MQDDRSALIETEHALLRFFGLNSAHDNGYDSPTKEAATAGAKSWFPQQQQPHPRHNDQKSQLYGDNASSCWFPPPPPKSWPQRPLYIRATPGSGTRIVRVRHCEDLNASLDIPQQLQQQHVPINTGLEAPGRCLVVDFCSPRFEGSLLVRIQGAPSLMQHHQHGVATTAHDYWKDRQRQFQAVVRGRFITAKPPPSLAQCVTGQAFRRRLGKLPATWLCHVVTSLIQRLAPQLHVQLEGSTPRSLAPLSATAQTIVVESCDSRDHHNQHEQHAIDKDGILYENDRFYDAGETLNPLTTTGTTMEVEFQEPPPDHPTSLVRHVVQVQHQQQPDEFGGNDPQQHLPLPQQLSHQQVLNYRKNRKRVMNHLAAQQPAQPNPCFDSHHEYTFEFYQHLLRYNDPHALLLHIPMVGNIPITHRLTNGQAIQLMSAVKRNSPRQQSPLQQTANNTAGSSSSSSCGHDDLDYLWHFEVWHESLYVDNQEDSG